MWVLVQGEDELLAKYKQSHLESYMEDNQRVAFCPSVPWCGRAVEVRAGGSVPVAACSKTYRYVGKDRTTRDVVANASAGETQLAM